MWNWVRERILDEFDNLCHLETVLWCESREWMWIELCRLCCMVTMFASGGIEQFNIQKSSHQWVLEHILHNHVNDWEQILLWRLFWRASSSHPLWSWSISGLLQYWLYYRTSGNYRIEERKCLCSDEMVIASIGLPISLWLDYWNEKIKQKNQIFGDDWQKESKE